jgi:hypothetical protein
MLADVDRQVSGLGLGLLLGRFGPCQGEGRDGMQPGEREREIRGFLSFPKQFKYLSLFWNLFEKCKLFKPKNIHGAS